MSNELIYRKISFFDKVETNSFDKVECCFDINAVFFGNNVERNFVFLTKSKHVQISFDIVTKNGNNVEATFDFVKRIVRLVAFDNVASTLLLVWTLLYASSVNL